MSQKPSLDFIIRGFLYRPNWTPLSSRKTRNKNYTINFLKNYDSYQYMLDKLQEVYDINLYFSTYDTTPDNYLDAIDKLMNPKQIFLSSEKGSHQFTTTKTILSKPCLSESTNLMMLIRSDIIVTNYFVETLCQTDYLDNILYVLCKERNHRDKVIDVFHALRGPTVKQKFTQYFNIPHLHAHRIHKHIYTKVLKSNGDHSCINTELCKEFYALYTG